MRNARFLFGLLTAASVGAVCAVGPRPVAAADSDKLLAEVRAAWEAREKATHKIRMSWATKCLTPKGGVDLMFPGSAKAGTPRPPTDTTHTGKGTLVLHGLTARCGIEMHIWSDPSAEYVLVSV